jgi:hypothetical protein
MMATLLAILSPHIRHPEVAFVLRRSSHPLPDPPIPAGGVTHITSALAFISLKAFRRRRSICASQQLST